MKEINEQSEHFLFLLNHEIDYQCVRLQNSINRAFKELKWRLENDNT